MLPALLPLVQLCRPHSASAVSYLLTRQLPWLHRFPASKMQQQQRQQSSAPGGSSSDSHGHVKRFALLVIGDEILKGQVSDTNSYFLCGQLTSLGHRVCEVSVIPDSRQLIAERVRALSAGYDFVITTGGIGPTHDDVTFEAVASAFQEATVYQPDLVAVVRRYFDKSADPSEPLEAYVHKPYMRLCRVPASAVLNYGYDRATGQRTDYPVVSVRNVFVFPGVPSLCQKAFRLVESQFNWHGGAASAKARDASSSSSSLNCDNVYVNRDEIGLTPVIDALVAEYPQLTVGSYPEWHNRYYKTRIYLESWTPEDLVAGRKFLTDRIDPAELVRYDPEPVVRANQKVDQFLAEADSRELSQFRVAYDTVLRALHAYGIEGVAVGFNGGKDCTALLHLVHAAVQQLQQQRQQQQQQQPLRLLYIRSRQQFPEAEQFIDESVQRYRVRLATYEGAMLACLTETRRDCPELRAIFMGTRRTDPRSAQLQYEQTTDVDKGWPEFVRVSPLLDWSYADIWHFLRRLSLPYCALYDHGYTSLGDMSNTHPNPRLQYKDKRGLLKYRPAYCLASGQDERRGRTPQQAPSTAANDAAEDAGANNDDEASSKSGGSSVGGGARPLL